MSRLRQFSLQFLMVTARVVPLVPDQKGNLYGGGLGGLSNGTVYQPHPNSDGIWSEHVIYSFAGGTDGREVESGVTFGRAGAM